MKTWIKNIKLNSMQCLIFRFSSKSLELMPLKPIPRLPLWGFFVFLKFWMITWIDKTPLLYWFPKKRDCYKTTQLHWIVDCLLLTNQLNLVISCIPTNHTTLIMIGSDIWEWLCESTVSSVTSLCVDAVMFLSGVCAGVLSDLLRTLAWRLFSVL